MPETTVTRQNFIDRLNEDLAREYQAIIAYVIYSQVLKGPEYMSIAEELETHAKEELGHAIKVAKHIDYLGGMPTSTWGMSRSRPDSSTRTRTWNSTRSTRGPPRLRPRCAGSGAWSISAARVPKRLCGRRSGGTPRRAWRPGQPWWPTRPRPV